MNEELTGRMICLFQVVGNRQLLDGLLSDVYIHAPRHDVHAFYTLGADTKKVVHIQGSPGMSTQNQARVWARLLDADKMESLRVTGIPIGDEHEATIKRFQNLEHGTMIPYDPQILDRMLRENI